MGRRNYTTIDTHRSWLHAFLFFFFFWGGVWMLLIWWRSVNSNFKTAGTMWVQTSKPFYNKRPTQLNNVIWFGLRTKSVVAFSGVIILEKDKDEWRKRMKNWLRFSACLDTHFFLCVCILCILCGPVYCSRDPKYFF